MANEGSQLMSAEKAFNLAREVLTEPERYPGPVVRAAAFLATDPASDAMRGVFVDSYNAASNIKRFTVGEQLPYPPQEEDYYLPGEMQAPGVEIGREAVNGWMLKILKKDLDRHLLIVGASGSGKSNFLKLIALGLAEIDK